MILGSDIYTWNY